MPENQTTGGPGSQQLTSILCTFHVLTFPRPPKISDSGYTVIKVIGAKGTVGPDGQDYKNVMFTAVGYNLPTAAGIEYRMYGEWGKNKYGVQFTVNNYEEVIEATEKGIKAYLGSGIIKGIGPKTAERIFAKFGTDTLQVLDNQPEKLLEVQGIKDKTYEKIMASYISMRGARDIVSMLAPYGVSSRRCVQIYTKFGAKATTIVKENPYVLSSMHGIGFFTADNIAKALGITEDAPERIKAGAVHVMREAETGGNLFRNEPSGNLCLPVKALIAKTRELLSSNMISEATVAKAIAELVEKEALSVRLRKFVFRKHTDKCEGTTAKSLIELKKGKVKPLKNLEKGLELAQKQLNCRLAPEQQEAVITTLSNPLTIVTGGPGTGKTMIQSVILKVLTAQYPNADIFMMAPTGKAARRMTESTGYPATTIHRALGLQITDNDTEMPTNKIEADFIIVDEISMLDIFLASSLFSSIKPGTRVLLVGDSDQLPSVGPGAVLADIIRSNTLPVVKLKQVYRQAGASLIAINAAKMRNACTELEEGDDFVIMEAADFSESADIMERIYLEEVKKHGIDNVAVLCPFRKNTESGVNAMNKRLQRLINPPRAGQKELKKGEDKTLRVGDRVMITKNEDDLANGDVGCVTRIYTDDGDLTADIDFGEGRVFQCNSSNIDSIELAYATTIHKSQGSEYKVVITNILMGHRSMLKRNLYYTSITRCKHKVYTVGSRKAIEVAIKTEDTSKRASLLPERLTFYNGL
jgi:exodeoxyribonuclease V alpha subunit